MSEKPTLAFVGVHHVDEQMRANCVRVLKEALAQAEAGELESILIISRRVDDRWRYEYTGVKRMTETIGQLTIVRHAWITEYLGA